MAIKKNEILPFAATWIGLEIIILSQTEKDKYYMTSHMWNLTNSTNELFYRIDSPTKQTYDYQRRKVAVGRQPGEGVEIGV